MIITILLLVQNVISVSISQNFKSLEFKYDTKIEVPYIIKNNSKRKINIQARYSSVYDYSKKLYIDEYKEYLDYLIERRKEISHPSTSFKMSELSNQDKIVNNSIGWQFVSLEPENSIYLTHPIGSFQADSPLKPGKYMVKIYIVEESTKQVFSDSAIFYINDKMGKFERNNSKNTVVNVDDQAKIINRINYASLDSLLISTAALKSNYKKELIFRSLGPDLGIRVYRKKTITIQELTGFLEKIKSNQSFQNMMPIFIEGMKRYIYDINKVVPSVHNDDLRNQIFTLLKNYEKP